MGVRYADRSDVHDLGGLKRGAFGNAGRLIDGISSGAFLLSAHGFVADTPVTFRAVEGGELATPLVEGTTYYAIPTSDSAFRVAATPGGAPIALTSAGSGMLVGDELPYDLTLEFYSRWVDDQIPHLVPLAVGEDGKYPMVPRTVVARLAAKALFRTDGQTSTIVADAEKEALQIVARWAAGQPTRDAGMTASANRAVTSAAPASAYGSERIP